MASPEAPVPPDGAKQTQPTLGRFARIIGWSLGLLFLLLGLSSFGQSAAAGILFLVGASVLLPPIRVFVAQRLNTDLRPAARFIVCVIAFIGAGSLLGSGVGLSEIVNVVRIGDSQSKLEQEILAKQKQRQEELRAELTSNREAIVEQARQLLADGELAASKNSVSKFASLNDPEINDILAEISEAERAKKERELYAEVLKVPASDYGKNVEYYSELAKLAPDNTKYADKLTYYQSKLDEQKKKQEAAARKLAQEQKRKQQRREWIERQFSAWDGSHRGLERVIKASMHNPDSYEHVRTVYSDKGDHLIVVTTFRGSNAFGGIVANSVKAKVDLEGRVLEILE